MAESVHILIAPVGEQPHKDACFTLWSSIVHQPVLSWRQPLPTDWGREVSVNDAHRSPEVKTFGCPHNQSDGGTQHAEERVGGWRVI